MPRHGRQTPTRSKVLKSRPSHGAEAAALYEESGRKALPWQARLAGSIMAYNRKGQWIHQKFGFSVPRRNGKNEVVAMRELWGLCHGEQICHTAHRTTTSHAAWTRLCRLLTDAGYQELGRPRRGEAAPERSFRLTKQYGLESIALPCGGSAVFRTRTPNGGLGEGFDLLVIDEAQEYTIDQESALIYTVSDSRNPQTLFCGTPPTATSSGTVFSTLRETALAGAAYDTGWAEWSIPAAVRDVRAVEAWYETNPSMGYHLDERKIRAELRGDVLDFNIQRLGLWVRYEQKSAISGPEWESCRAERLPELRGRLYAGVKYGKDGTNAALSIAVRTEDGRILVETLDCRSTRDGNDWILGFLTGADVGCTAIDGAGGQQLLARAMTDVGLASPVLPTVKEIILANAAFERGIQDGRLCHMGQPSLTSAAANCGKRQIGSHGGFGYVSLRDDTDIALLESAALAYWCCASSRAGRQTISF